jgi:transcriptional regulator with XRE-family HTH domain
MEKEKIIHQGRNVKRFREMFGMKQTGLAAILGKGWDQKQVSLLESKEEIEPKILDEVAKALKISPEAIQKFDQDAAIQIISNTFNDESAAYAYYYKCTFNPIDLLIKNYEERIKEKDALIRKLSKGKK